MNQMILAHTDADFFDAKAQRHKGSQRFFRGFFAALRLRVKGGLDE